MATPLPTLPLPDGALAKLDALHIYTLEALMGRFSDEASAKNLAAYLGLSPHEVDDLIEEAQRRDIKVKIRRRVIGGALIP